MFTLIAAALVLGTFATIERGLARTATLLRIAEVTLLPHNYANAAFLLRLDIRRPTREQVRYPGAWGDMAQTISDDIYF